MADRPRAFNPEELFEILDMVPRPPADANHEEAIEIAQAILRQAAEDFLEPRQSLAVPVEIQGRGISAIRQWVRMARSRAKKIEMSRKDAEEFLFSPWFESLCDSLEIEPEAARDAIFSREEP